MCISFLAKYLWIRKVLLRCKNYSLISWRSPYEKQNYNGFFCPSQEFWNNNSFIKIYDSFRELWLQLRILVIEKLILTRKLNRPKRILVFYFNVVNTFHQNSYSSFIQASIVPVWNIALSSYEGPIRLLSLTEMSQKLAI